MKTMTKALTLVALLSLFTLGMAPAQEIPSGADLNLWQVLSSILYGLIGIALYYLAYIVFDRFAKLDLHRELVEDQNMALGIMLAGLFVGIGILVAAVIS